jgi:hypothetical protein
LRFIIPDSLSQNLAVEYLVVLPQAGLSKLQIFLPRKKMSAKIGFGMVGVEDEAEIPASKSLGACADEFGRSVIIQG